jgi:hypothetical protein
MNILHKSKLIPLILGVSLFGISLSVAAADAGSRDADAWKFGAELYLWAPWIDVTTETGGDVEISLDDILNNLDMLFMGALGVGKGKWSLVADIIYFDLESNENSDLSPRAEIRSVDLSAWVVTPQVRYSAFETTEYRIDLLAGARYIDIEADTKLDVRLPLLSITESRKATDSGSNWDGIVGIAGQMNLPDKWYLLGYLDVGTGDSDYTWQAQASAGYRFRKVDAVAGYRYLDYDLGSDAALSDLTVHGPYAGVKFNF